MGQDMIVGVVDTGIDYRNAFFYDSVNSVPFGTEITGSHRKIALYDDYCGRKEFSTKGHGTHVTGTILGKSYNDEQSDYNVLH